MSHTEIVTYTHVSAPKFLQLLSYDTIKSEADNVYNTVFSLLSRKDNPNEHRAMSALQGLTYSITQMPLSSSSLPDILDGWSGLENLKRRQCSTGLGIRKLQASIMLINYTAWYWLDIFIADQCRKILAGTFPSGGNWLADLVSDIETLYTSTSTEQLVLRATDYDIDLPDTSHVLNQSRIRISEDKN